MNLLILACAVRRYPGSSNRRRISHYNKEKSLARL
jgi:hypothetical protein